MLGVRLPYCCDDLLAAGNELADELQANASARAHDDPGGRLLVAVERIGNLVHVCCRAGGNYGECGALRRNTTCMLRYWKVSGDRQGQSDKSSAVVSWLGAIE